MPSHITIRKVPPDVASELEQERQRRGATLNDTVIDLLRRALGLGPARAFDNGLARFAGTWTQDELEKFESDTACFEQIDPELWS